MRFLADTVKKKPSRSPTALGKAGALARAVPVVLAVPAAVALMSLALLASCTFDLDYDKYALVYGVSDYPSGYNDLASTDDDAQDINDLLLSQGFQVVLRVTESPAANEAHDTNLYADFNDAATTAKLGMDDLFVFYYSGHGTQLSPGSSEHTPGTDEMDEAIVLVNDTLTDVVFITDDQLAALMRTVPCARRIVILDACYSGGFISNSLGADAVSPDYDSEGTEGIFETLGNAIYLYANFQDYGSDIPPGDALVIAASGEQDFAYEIDGNGVMTRYLLESAANGDVNRDGYVTVSESYFYIYRNINKNFNLVYGPSGLAFFPHLSGSPVDYVLFE
jgi:hypothetical protein